MEEVGIEEEGPVLPVGNIDGLGPAVAQEGVERKIGMKADMAGKPGEASFHKAEDDIFAHEVVDDDDRSAGDAHAPHFGRETGRVRNHGGDVKGEHRIKGVVGKFKVLGIHHVELLDVGERLLVLLLGERVDRADLGAPGVEALEPALDLGALLVA